MIIFDSELLGHGNTMMQNVSSPVDTELIKHQQLSRKRIMELCNGLEWMRVFLYPIVSFKVKYKL